MDVWLGCHPFEKSPPILGCQTGPYTVWNEWKKRNRGDFLLLPDVAMKSRLWLWLWLFWCSVMDTIGFDVFKFVLAVEVVLKVSSLEFSWYQEAQHRLLPGRHVELFRKGMLMKLCVGEITRIAQYLRDCMVPSPRCSVCLGP